MNKMVPILTSGALVAVTALGLLFFSAYAQEPTPEPEAEISPDTQDLPWFKGSRGHLWGASSEDLAAALGISEDELDTVYEGAVSAAIDQAVEAGLITEAQADEIREERMVFPFGRFWSGWLADNGIDFQVLLAGELGISVEELQAAYQQAYNARIDKAVASGDLTDEQADLLKGEHALYNNPGFQESMSSAFASAVNQAVEDGLITQSQADQILENMEGRSFPGFGGGRSFHRGRHGPSSDGEMNILPNRLAPVFQFIVPSVDM